MPIPKSKPRARPKPKAKAMEPEAPAKLPLGRYQTHRNILLGAAQALNRIMQEETLLFDKGEVWDHTLQARDWALLAIDAHDARTLAAWPEYVVDQKFSTDAVRGSSEFNAKL